MATAQKQSSNKFDGMGRMQVMAYGIGHFINDLTAACWFNYLLFFLKSVVETPAAASALLFGQICDAICTPIVGYLSDKYSTRYGKRTPWYIFGLILVLIGFLPIFHVYQSNNQTYQFYYYTIFPCIFNIGWASLQISHMSLAPALTCSRKRRDQLSNLRNFFTFLSNLAVLAMGLIFFSLMKDKQMEYKLIAYIVIGMGVLSSLFFLYFINENKLVRICLEKKQSIKEKIKEKNKNKSYSNQNKNQIVSEESNTHRSTLSKFSQIHTVTSQRQDQKQMVEEPQKVLISQWFKMPKFYLFGLCYMCVRLNTNIYGTFLPFYLIHILKISAFSENQQNNTIPFSLALVPLLSYFASSLISFKMNVFYERIGRKLSLVVGTAIGVISFVLLGFLREENSDLMYLLAIFIGISQSMILSTGINLISDVIGTKTDTGALVYGLYSFLDKLSTGLFIYYISNSLIFSNQQAQSRQNSQQVLKQTIIYLPIVTCLTACIIVSCFKVDEYNVFKKEENLTDSVRENEQFINSCTLK